jgi:hypothetical protein
MVNLFLHDISGDIIEVHKEGQFIRTFDAKHLVRRGERLKIE